MTDIIKVPKRHLSEVEKEYVELSIEKLKIKRERSLLVLNKGTALYFFLTVIGVIGVLLKKIDYFLLGIFIVGGLLALVVSILPYIESTKKEEDELLDLIDSILGEKN